MREQSTKPRRDNFLLAGVLLCCATVLFVTTLLTICIPATWYFIHKEYHAILETLGCMLALGVAGFLVMRHGEKGNGHKLWVACSMLVMAILDAFHASVAPSHEFIWLRSTAQLIGGVFITLIWLPDRFSHTRIAEQLPRMLAAACGLFGVISLAFPEILPTTMSDGEFTLLPQMLNLVGCFLFLAGVVYFAYRFSRSQDRSHLLFAACCLMFIVSGLAFRLSCLWDAEWWLSHLIRLGAYVIAFGYVSTNSVAEYVRLNHTEEAVTRLAALVECSNDAIVGTTTDGSIVSWNSGAEKLFGYSWKEVQGQSGSVLIPLDRLDEETKIFATVHAENAFFHTKRVLASGK